jgi:hypothetical protein
MSRLGAGCRWESGPLYTRSANRLLTEDRKEPTILNSNQLYLVDDEALISSMPREFAQDLLFELRKDGEHPAWRGRWELSDPGLQSATRRQRQLRESWFFHRCEQIDRQPAPPIQPPDSTSLGSEPKGSASSALRCPSSTMRKTHRAFSSSIQVPAMNNVCPAPILVAH